MKNIITLLSFCFCLIVTTLPAQDASWVDKIQQEWVLKKGWWGDQEMVFELKSPAIHQNGLFKVFNFSTDQHIKFQLYNPQEFGMCGNGLFFLNAGSWKQTKDDQLQINLTGGRYLEDRFEFSANFNITEINENSLTLSLAKEITNKTAAFN
ncbi:MAG: hypothetical protein AB8G15_17910 [Saprospiraceae bacterium]